MKWYSVLNFVVCRYGNCIKTQRIVLQNRRLTHDFPAHLSKKRRIYFCNIPGKLNEDLLLFCINFGNICTSKCSHFLSIHQSCTTANRSACQNSSCPLPNFISAPFLFLNSRKLKENGSVF